MSHARTQQRGVRLLAALVTACCALVAICAAADARAPARTCKPRGSQTILQTRAARFYAVTTGPAGEYGAPTALYVCEFARRTQVPLMRFPEGLAPSVSRARFNGGYVAFELSVEDVACGKYDPTGNCASDSVRSYGLRKGRLRASTRGPVQALALTTGGWLAWVGSAPSGSAVLQAIDSTGRRQLDTGAIDPASLVVLRSVVRWSNGGVPHSAVLR